MKTCLHLQFSIFILCTSFLSSSYSRVNQNLYDSIDKVRTDAITRFSWFVMSMKVDSLSKWHLESFDIQQSDKMGRKKNLLRQQHNITIQSSFEFFECNNNVNHNNDFDAASCRESYEYFMLKKKKQTKFTRIEWF